MSVTQSAVDITMPRLSDSMEEATILKWLKAPGEAVAHGDALVEIETDKATMVYEAEADGVLGELLVGEGETAALGAPIARLLMTGDASPPPSQTVAPQPPAASPSPAARSAGAASAPPKPPPRTATRPRATPVARRVAADRGVDLAAVQGSGPYGRIVRADVLAVASVTGAAVPATAPASAAPGERVELTATQRTIARHMVASRTEVPEFTLTREIDVTAALRLRRQLAELHPEGRVSVNDLVVKAVALALREHPKVNSSWAGDHVVRHRHVGVGVAVAVDDGLLVPVVADADGRGLLEIAAETRRLGERARTRSVTPSELTGATFTVSNLGMLGVHSFTAVIDVPQVAILAVGAVVNRPVFDADGAVVARDLMQVTLNCDHRVVYGADGARFLQRLAELLEQPTLLLLPPPKPENGRNER